MQRHLLHKASMPTHATKNERLRAARIQAGFPSAAQAARRLGVPYGTYTGHENGLRGIKESELKRYAKAFGVSVSWLLFGEEPDKLVDELSGLFGIVGFEPSGRISNPQESPDRDLLKYPKIQDRPSMIVIVAGPHARGIAENGWHLYVDREFVPISKLHINKLCICKLNDGSYYLRTVQKGSVPNLYNLEGPLYETMRDQKLRAVAEVVAILTHCAVREIEAFNEDLHAVVWQGVLPETD